MTIFCHECEWAVDLPPTGPGSDPYNDPRFTTPNTYRCLDNSCQQELLLALNPRDQNCLQNLIEESNKTKPERTKRLETAYQNGIPLHADEAEKYLYRRRDALLKERTEFIAKQNEQPPASTVPAIASDQDNRDNEGPRGTARVTRTRTVLPAGEGDRHRQVIDTFEVEEEWEEGDDDGPPPPPYQRAPSRRPNSEPIPRQQAPPSARPDPQPPSQRVPLRRPDSRPQGNPQRGLGDNVRTLWS